MIYAINYSDNKFEKNRRFNSLMAKKIGRVDQVIEYSPDSLDPIFSEKYRHILSEKRGGGLWLWKPYIILDALEKIKNGEYLIYTDAGSFFIRDVRRLIDVMKKDNNKLMVFELPLLGRQFTKKETFVKMNYFNYTHNQILAGYLCMEKSDEVISFIKEWLHYMSDITILSGKKHDMTISEFPDFIAHREDQSVFSIICRKHNITPYRDPSQFGNRPWQYASKERKIKIHNYPNSDYPIMIISNRKSNPLPYAIKECFKIMFCKFGLWGQKSFFKKHNIPQSQIL